MKEKIIEILKKDIELSLTGNYKSAYIDGIDKAAVDLNAAFEQNLRDELIKFTDKNFTDIIGDGTIFVDEYLADIVPEEYIDKSISIDQYMNLNPGLDPNEQ